MKSPLPLALALLLAPALSPAQTAQNSPAVADPAATIPPSEYRSALTQGPRGVAQDKLDWQAANAEVGRHTRGHIDILKWEQAQGSAPRTTEPAAPPAPAPRPTTPMHRH